MERRTMIASSLRSLIIPTSGGSREVHNSTWPLTLENPNLDLRDPSTWEAIFESSGSSRSAAGIRVSHEDLLTFGPIMRALKVLGGDTACSPMHVCWREGVDPGDDTIDQSHPAEFIVSRRWNNVTPAAAGWERIVQEAGLYGAGYAWIERDSQTYTDPRKPNWGSITGMYHLVPLVTRRRQASDRGWLGSDETGWLYVEPGDVYYTSVVDNQTVYLAYNEVFEYRMFRGAALPMLKILRDAVGLALASRGFLSKFFANGAQAGGFIQMPAETTPNSAVNLQKELQRRVGSNSWFKVHILRDGAKFQQLTVDPKSADMKEIDAQAALQVCHFYNLNPNKMGLPGSDSYGAGESARVDHITGTMNHIFTQIEGEAFVKMFPERTQRMTGRRAREFRHDYSRLVAPDYATQVEKLLELRSAAVISANDVLSKLNWKTRTDPDADRYYNPSTSSRDLDKADELESNNDQETDDAEDSRQSEMETNRRRAAIEPRVRSALNDLTNLVSNRTRKPEAFQTLVRTRFGEHRAIFRDEVRPTLSLWLTDPEPLLAVAERQFFEDYGTALQAAILEQDSDCKDAAAARRRLVNETRDEFSTTYSPQIVDLLVSGTATPTDNQRKARS